jgi:pimeloyl-ACP methyl ester carboxylesterase
VSAVEEFEPRLPEGWHEGLRERLARTRWPELGDEGWDFGLDARYLRELCAHWADRYDPDRLTRRLDRFSNRRWEGIHFVWERAGGEGVPVVLVHGWPGGPTEFCEVIPRLLEAGHDAIVPSLPGYAFSEAPDRPLNATGIARRLRALVEEGLGYERYALQGGDWGAMISSRIAFDSPERVAALHLNLVSVLPLPGNLADPPLTEAEQAYLAAAQRWLRREGFHLMVQGGAPDAVAVAFNDSPAGLAAWLVEKYRRWSDCDGEVERRFSKDDLCDLLTMYWATGTIGSSMRLYAAEARDRWRLAPGERIEVPAAVADFPAEILRAPREWAERIFSDLRRWSEMPRGGHFAAFEEPELFAADLVAFLAEVGR